MHSRRASFRLKLKTHMVSAGIHPEGVIMLKLNQFHRIIYAICIMVRPLKRSFLEVPIPASVRML